MDTLMNINEYYADPPCRNSIVKTKTKFKNQLYKKYIKMVIRIMIFISFRKQ